MLCYCRRLRHACRSVTTCCIFTATGRDGRFGRVRAIGREMSRWPVVRGPCFGLTEGMTSQSGRRGWVRVGHAWNAQARDAGATAAREARDGLDPKLLLVFASFGYDLRDLLDGVT